MSNRDYSAGHKINRLINSSTSKLGNIIGEANRILALQKIVLSALPSHYQDHCCLASYRNGTLILHSDTAAWATKIRFQQSPLMAAIRNNSAFKNIQKIRVLVRPTYQRPAPKIKAKSISKINIEHMEEIADTIEEKALGHALRSIVTDL